MGRSPGDSISGGLCVQTWWAVVIGVSNEMDDWWLTVSRGRLKWLGQKDIPQVGG